MQKSARVAVGQVELLGFGENAVGIPPRWSHEPISGKQAPVAHWRSVPFLDESVVGDHVDDHVDG